MINIRIAATILFLFSSLITFASAQSHRGTDTAKFYVVVSVVGTILAGIFLMLLYLDRKITRLEQQSTKK